MDGRGAIGAVLVTVVCKGASAREDAPPGLPPRNSPAGPGRLHKALHGTFFHRAIPLPPACELVSVFSCRGHPGSYHPIYPLEACGPGMGPEGQSLDPVRKPLFPTQWGWGWRTGRGKTPSPTGPQHREGGGRRKAGSGLITKASPQREFVLTLQNALDGCPEFQLPPSQTPSLLLITQPLLGANLPLTLDGS